jgi:uncharacterized protein YjiS (DUF1127 family)
MVTIPILTQNLAVKMVQTVSPMPVEATMSIGVQDRGWIVLRQSGEFAARLALRLSGLVDAWTERHRQRRALLELNDHMLKDIGIGRGDAYREGRKPFWRD